jgi:hypothetical protein
LHNLIEYANLSYKTEEQYYVSTLNCSKENIYEDMMMTKRRYHKTNGILAFHAIQSFSEGEVTPELAHKIGIEFAKEMWGDRFEVVVSTHINTKHIHNHFCINSVSFKDGKKYYDNHKNYALMREISDRICEEYNLSVLKEKKCKKSNLNYSNFYQSEIKKSHYTIVKEDIDFAIGQAYSFNDFINILKKMNYEVENRAGKLSIRRLSRKRNIRIERVFGEDYSISKIEERIFNTNDVRVPFPEVRTLPKRYKIKNNIKLSKKNRVKGIRALYLYYCYILQVYPKRKYKTQNKMSEYMKNEIKKMKALSEEAILLNKNKINTIEELGLYKNNAINKRKILNSQKENLYRKLKKSKNNIERDKIYNEIQILSQEIFEIKKEISLLENIEIRIPIIKNEVQEKMLNLKEKEKEANERI